MMESQRYSIGGPNTIASLPRPYDKQHGRTRASPVYGYDGSHKRKRSEIVTGVDGESISIYGVGIILTSWGHLSSLAQGPNSAPYNLPSNLTTVLSHMSTTMLASPEQAIITFKTIYLCISPARHYHKTSQVGCFRRRCCKVQYRDYHFFASQIRMRWRNI